MSPIQKIVFPVESNLLPEEIATVLSKWTIKKSVKRFDFLIQKGRKASHLYFITKGTMRIFCVNKKQEICVGFGYKDTLICSYPSFISNQPSDYYIQALTDTELIGISKTDFYECVHNSWNLERHWRQMTELALLGRIEREVDLVTYSPKERLERLLARSPHLFQFIPNKYIASYLRMTPETLSRMLSKGNNKK